MDQGCYNLRSAMKQLLSIAKQRKDKDKDGKSRIKAIIDNAHILQDQQDNFIYEEDSNVQEGPTQQQIATYAEILGIKLPEEEDLLYIARECLNQPMPEGWHCQEDKMGEIIYVNEKTGEVTFEHPCDEIFRQKVISERKKKINNIKKAVPKINIQKSKTSFVENAFKAKAEAPPSKESDNEDQSDKLQNFRKSKNQGNTLGQNIKSIKDLKSEPFLYDDDYEPVNPVNIHKRKKDGPAQIHQPLPKLQLKEKLPEKQSSMVKLLPFQKRANPELLASKRAAIEQKIRLKYEHLNKELEQKQIQHIKQLKSKEEYLRNADLTEIVQIYGEAKIEGKKKEIEMRLMLDHAQKLDRKRLEFEREYRNNILSVSSKYQVEQLFTEMAQCRKFISERNSGTEDLSSLEEMERNMRVVNELEVGKLVVEVEAQAQALMHSVLEKIIKQRNGGEMKWEREAELRDQFQKGLEAIIEKHRVQNSLGSQSPQEAQPLPQNKRQEQIKSQANQVYEELQKLKSKLRELQDENNTQRSNLSDKQSKLVSLLQSRAGSSSSRS